MKPAESTISGLEAPDFIEFEYRRLVNPYTGEVPAQLKYLQLLQIRQALQKEQSLEKERIFEKPWLAVDDFFATLAVTDIASDPNAPNTMYFCTGEGRFNADATRGAGIWKSTDAGESWSRINSTATEDFYYCQVIQVHPANSFVYAGTNNGLFRSEDGGNTWELILGNGESTDRTDVADLEISADGSLFASFGSIAERGSIFYSAYGDRGTWEERVQGIPSGAHRIELACAPSEPRRIYAIPVRNDVNNRRIFGIYRSNDAGMTWEAVADPGGDKNFAAQQGWYDLIAQVHPDDPDFVLIGGLNIWRSIDGGANWQQLTEGNRRIKSELPYVHVDQHEIVFLNADTVLFGNDGGIYRCDSIRTSKPGFYDLNANYNVTQFYTGRIEQERNGHFVLGGTQDNGSQGSTDHGISEFDLKSWADGSFCAINHEDPGIFFTTTQYRRMYRNRHGDIDTITNPYITNNNTQFINPMMMDPNDPELIYQASNLGIWRLSNASMADSTQWKRATRPFGIPAAMALSKNVRNIGFAAMYNTGRVFRIEGMDQTTEGYSPVDIDPLGQLPRPDRINPSCIAVDPADANHLIITYSNYGVDHVWECRNALGPEPTWTHISGDLPDIPVSWALISPFDPNVCYLGTELGVMMTTKVQDSLTKWESMNTGLAYLRVSMLDIRPNDRTLLAATHGRGMYTCVLGADHKGIWKERGPNNVGGRTRAILPDPNDSEGRKVWAGSVSGGLWYTSDIHRVREYTEPAVSADAVPRLAPNPVNDKFRVVFKSASGSKAVLEMYDVRGSKINTYELLPDATGLYDGAYNCSGIVSGLYFLRIAYGGTEHVVRFIKE